MLYVLTPCIDELRKLGSTLMATAPKVIKLPPLSAVHEGPKMKPNSKRIQNAASSYTTLAKDNKMQKLMAPKIK
ncbi:hypothetical protein LCGC14_0146710 [marine sediment metagenome]|uniref:Uncharacterized protein n=1 Tax=marine sediment metagenome TaxID=412755 RepID=A0A0F9V3I9_9ZZZZ